MDNGSPQLLFRRRSHLAALDALQKHPRQLAFAGMAFAVHRAQVKELVHERVALALLRKYALQRYGKLTQPRRLRPGFLRFIANRMAPKKVPGARARTRPAGSAVVR